MRFDEYRNRFETVALERENGVLTLRVHTDGGPLLWSRLTHVELAEAFYCISVDDANEVLILTGTGDAFSGPAVPIGGSRQAMGRQSIDQWNSVFVEGRRLIFGLMDLEIPVIGVVNGPAYRHPELPLLGDIVLASDTAIIQDAAHFTGGLVPGDGVHVVFPALMGPNRGRYFLTTGQALDAATALDFGLVNEVLAPDLVMPRAHELADQLLLQPRYVRRYTRLLLMQELRDRMQRLLPLGITLEGLAVMDGNDRLKP